MLTGEDCPDGINVPVDAGDDIVVGDGCLVETRVRAGAGEGRLACGGCRVGVQVGVGKAVLVGEGWTGGVGVLVGVGKGWLAGTGVPVGVGEGWTIGLEVSVGIGEGVGEGVGVAGWPTINTVRFNRTLAPLCQRPVWSAGMPGSSNSIVSPSRPPSRSGVSRSSPGTSRL